MAADPPMDVVLDDRPIAVRRKRRVPKVIINHTGASAAKDTHVQTNVEGQAREGNKTASSSATTTPRKKRVRISEPGLELMPQTSTGLTPALKRHRLARTPTKPIRFAGRRQSLPAQLTSPALGSATTLQFAPLRQVIDGRSRRRLRRNHLSEETNAIEKEKRLEEKVRRDDIEALRDEVEEKERWVKALMKQLQAVKGAGKQPSVCSDLDTSFGSSGRQGVQAVGKGRDELPQHEPAVEESSNIQERQATPSIDVAPHVSFGTEANNGADDNMAGLETRGQTPLPVAAAKTTASASVQVDMVEPAQQNLEEQVKVLGETLQQVTSELETTRGTHQRISAKLKSHLEDSSLSFDGTDSDLDTALNMVLTSLVLAQTRADDAQAGLEAVSTNVAELGFDGRDAEEMLAAIKQSFRQARLELEYLQPGENVIGFENDKLLNMLVERVQTLLHKLRDSTEEQVSQRQVATVLQKRLDLVDAHAQGAKAKARELAVDVDEKERSIKKLQHALEGYQAEVKSLENLVTQLEASHTEESKRMQTTMDEAVADLELKLEEEMRSKEEILQEAHEEKRLTEELQAKVDKAKSIIERMNKEKDILNAAKDAIISRAEVEAGVKDRALAECRAELEELGRDKGVLASALDEAETSIGVLTDANTALEARLALELEDGVRVMETMQSEMMRSLARAGELKNKYANKNKAGGHGVAVSLPATPCSLRFATPKKRRRKVDSGIGVLEEEDEEMLDVVN